MNPAARAMESLDRYQALERVPDVSARLEGGLKYKAYPHGEEIHYAPEPSVCHLVVTFRSLLWMFMGILGTFVVLVSLATPHWLVGKHRWIGVTSHHTNGSVFELGVVVFLSILLQSCTLYLVPIIVATALWILILVFSFPRPAI